MKFHERGFRTGDIVRHFKGGMYRVYGVARHTETGEVMVLYTAIGEHAKKVGYGIWARPEEMFCSLVDREKYPDADQVYRMERVEEKNQEAY